MQRHFGAKITVTPHAFSDWQTFFAIGLNVAGLVRAHGGRVVLNGGGWVVAELGFSQAMALRGAHGIQTVAGVSIDRERMESLLKLNGAMPKEEVTNG